MIRQINQRPGDEGQVIEVARMTLCEGSDYDAEGYRSLLSPRGRKALESLLERKATMAKREDSLG